MKRKIGIVLTIFFLLGNNTSMLFANNDFEIQSHELENSNLSGAISKEKNKEVTKSEFMKTQITAEEGAKKIGVPPISAAVGASIANTFSDPNLAQAVADTLTGGDVNAILTQTMVDNLDYLDASQRDIQDLTGIDVLINLKGLDLAFNQLTTLPESIGSLNSLEYLELVSNQLTSLPESIGDLNSLDFLSVPANQLESVPENIVKLSNLRNLYLDRNNLTSLPENIGNLGRLEYLILTDNDLTSLPENIGNLSSLQNLYVENNHLTILPESVSNLSNLMYLSLNNNELERLPENIGNLSRLRALYSNNNQLVILPESIVNLTRMNDLYLNDNQLTELPENIGNLSGLINLYLVNNHLVNVPTSIEELSVLEYLLLDNNELSDFPEGIEGLVSIGYLSLKSNQLTSLPASIGNLRSMWYVVLEDNLLPTNYEDTLNTLGLSFTVSYEPQRQLTLQTGLNPYIVTSASDINNENLFNTVKLSDGDNVLPGHTLILENYVDENGNHVDLKDYLDNGKVIKAGEVFAQVRATGTGLFPNNSDHAITIDRIQLSLRIPAVRYDLSFNLNGGEGTAPATQTVVEGETATEVKAPTRSGFIFKGWNTESNGSGMTWEFETTAMPSNNVTLYAQWEKNNEAAHISETVEKGLPKTGNYKLFILGISLLTLGSVLLIKKIKEN